MVNAEQFVRISEETKKILDKLKQHPRETYDDVISILAKEKFKK